MIRELLAVGAGGALGSVARYVLSYYALSGQLICGLPVGTLTVNAAGSLLIGLIARTIDSALLTQLLVIGFCGGFTTFSTFSIEMVRMARSGDYTTAALYAAASISVCLSCTVAGLWLGGLLKSN